MNIDIEKIEKQISETIKEEIRLEKFNRKRKETLHEFLIKFFTDFNINKKTIYKKDKSIQTPANKRRSLGDIYMICKYYYPNISVKDVIYELYIGLREDVKIEKLRTSYCSMINKRVWYYNATVGLIGTKNLEDEYGYKYDEYLALFN